MKLTACDLCAADAHDDPEELQDLVCPGANGTQEDKDAFVAALAAKYVEEVVAQEHAKEERESDDLKTAWASRVRNPEATHEALVADVVERTGTEVTRQITEGVFETPELDIDVPHLTVPGKVPSHSGITANERPRAKGFKETDYLLFTQGDTEVPDHG